MTTTTTTTTTQPTSTTAPISEKKQCFTKGLMDRLKARSAIVRPAGYHSKLPIFIWESPPLGKLYRITFLARLEDDDQEGLGFRFDDTVSDSPRDLVWGGMVGTTEAPGCFLDGTQTFLTESTSKASDRCRKGWHVRIGKISQILEAFENVEDSLVMKVSLRKLDPSTQLTNLTLHSSKSTIIHPIASHPFQARRPLPLRPPPSSPRLSLPAQPILSLLPLATSGSSTPNNTRASPPLLPPARRSSPSPPTPEHAPSRAGTSRPTTPDSKPGDEPPPLPPKSSIPDPVPAEVRDPVLAEELEPAPVEVDAAAHPSDPDPISDSAPPEAPSPNPIPSLQGESQQMRTRSPGQMACLVFPSVRNRTPPKKLYIRLDQLKNLEYFRRALNDESNRVAVDAGHPSVYPPIEILLNTLWSMFQTLIQPGITRLQARAQMFLSQAPVISRVVHLIHKHLFPSARRLTMKLSSLVASAVQAVLKELVDLTDAVLQEKDEDMFIVKKVWFIVTLSRVRAGLGLVLRCWQNFQNLLENRVCSTREDQEEELECFCETNEELPVGQEVRATLLITDAAFITYRALADYLHYRAVKFAPLRSTFESQRALACSIQAVFPSDYKSFVRTHSVILRDGPEATNGGPERGLTACDPLSLYKLAERLNIEELKRLTYKHLLSCYQAAPLSYDLLAA